MRKEDSLACSMLPTTSRDFSSLAQHVHTGTMLVCMRSGHQCATVTPENDRRVQVGYVVHTSSPE